MTATRPPPWRVGEGGQSEKGTSAPFFRGVGYSLFKSGTVARNNRDPGARPGRMAAPRGYLAGVTAVSNSTGIPPLLERKAGRSGSPVRLASFLSAASTATVQPGNLALATWPSAA